MPHPILYILLDPNPLKKAFDPSFLIKSHKIFLILNFSLVESIV